jgi:hypothetical protein
MLCDLGCAVGGGQRTIKRELLIQYIRRKSGHTFKHRAETLQKYKSRPTVLNDSYFEGRRIVYLSGYLFLRVL